MMHHWSTRIAGVCLILLTTVAAQSGLAKWHQAAVEQHIVGPAAGDCLPAVDLKYELQIQYNEIGSHDIVPDCSGASVPTTFSPMVVGVDGRNADQDVPLYYTRNMPSVSWPVTSDDKTLRTVMMHDFDGQYHHWSAWNVFGTTVNDIADLVQPYSCPLNWNTKKNRYVFMVFEQPDGEITLDPADVAHWSTPVAGRFGFNVTAVADKYGLGPPVAINWMHVGVDAYVPGAWNQVFNSPQVDAGTKAYLKKNYDPVGNACKALGY